MTAVSPERAAYEADPWRPPDIAWEELFNEDKDKYRGIAQAVIKASPELAEALAKIATAERFCRELVERGGGSGHPATVARTVLAYLGGTPMASPETSAAAIAQVPPGQGS